MAQADELDTFQFRAGQSIERESNVFRLSDSANTQALLGTPQRSDTIGVSTVGFKINKPYSLQRFELDMFAERHTYKTFSSLNFTGLNYSAAWRWSLTPAFHGNLVADRRVFIDSVADVQNLGQVNRRTDRVARADAEYELGGAWRLVGGVSKRNFNNSQITTFRSDSEVMQAEAGVRYVYPSGTALSYRYRDGKGNYPTRQLSNFYAKDFRDREHEFRVDAAPLGRTTLRGRLSNFQRRHTGLSARDFSGITGQVEANFAATPKTSFRGGYVRELDNYQTNTESYFLGNRFFFEPTYKATQKITVRLRFDHGKRDYQGALPGFASRNRVDTNNVMMFSTEYKPVRSVTLLAWLQRDQRASSVPGFNYRNNAVGLSALANF